MKKQKLLIIGINMNCAGTEKSFISFANTLDYDKYDVELLLAKKEGMLLELIPSQIKVTEMKGAGELFLMSGKNAASTLWNCFIKKNPFDAFIILPYFIKLLLFKESRSSIATRLWIRMMKKLWRPDESYDIAVAYWGDRTMFYMVDMINAKKKIAWLHFDYGNPPRDDSIYLPYFEKCDAVVTVSRKVDDALRDKLPSLNDKAILIENINDPSLIKSMAEKGDGFADAFSGKRILTVGRIAYQKGLDFVPAALKRLIDEGHDLKWYILGDGDEDTVNELKAAIQREKIGDRCVFLGTTINPYKYIRDCDIFLLPSRFEGKPITVEEAKILSKPIVVSNYLSAEEQLCGGKYGVICDIGANGVYEGLSRMLSENLEEHFTKVLSAADFSNRNEIEKFYAL